MISKLLLLALPQVTHCGGSPTVGCKDPQGCLWRGAQGELLGPCLSQHQLGHCVGDPWGAAPAEQGQAFRGRSLVKDPEPEPFAALLTEKS